MYQSVLVVFQRTCTSTKASTMSKAILFAVICSLFVAIEGASLAKSDEATSTIFVTDLLQFLHANPGFKLMGEMNKIVESRVNIAYTLGSRIAGKKNQSTNYFVDKRLSALNLICSYSPCEIRRPFSCKVIRK